MFFLKIIWLVVSLIFLVTPALARAADVVNVTVTVIDPNATPASAGSTTVPASGGGGGLFIEIETVAPKFIPFDSQTSGELVRVRKVNRLKVEVCWRADKKVWGELEIGHIKPNFVYLAKTSVLLEAHCVVAPLLIGQTYLFFTITIYDQFKNWSSYTHEFFLPVVESSVGDTIPKLSTPAIIKSFDYIKNAPTVSPVMQVVVNTTVLVKTATSTVLNVPPASVVVPKIENTSEASSTAEFAPEVLNTDFTIVSHQPMLRPEIFWTNEAKLPETTSWLRRIITRIKQTISRLLPVKSNGNNRNH